MLIKGTGDLLLRLRECNSVCCKRHVKEEHLISLQGEQPNVRRGMKANCVMNVCLQRQCSTLVQESTHAASVQKKALTSSVSLALS